MFRTVFNLVLLSSVTMTSLAAPFPAPTDLAPLSDPKDPIAVINYVEAVSALNADSGEPLDGDVMDSLIEDESEQNQDGPSDDHCDSVCGLHYITGATNEREALCSREGLGSTLACAICIDETWPDTTWEDSAMAEYEKIANACAERTSQEVFRTTDNL